MNIFERNAKKVVVAAVFAAAFSSIFVRLIEAPAVVIGFYRLTFALPFFAAAAFGWHRKELGSIALKDLGGSLLAGIFLAAHFFTWFTALEYTTVASATIICMMHPIVILVITVLIFKEKTNFKAVMGVLTAFAGAAVISGGDYTLSREAIFGDFMAFLGAVFIALYFLAGRKFRKNLNNTVYVFLVFAGCWAVFAIGMLASGASFTNYSAADFMWMLLMTLVCQIGAHALFNWSFAYVSPLYVATLENGEALIASALAAVIFSEIPTLWQWIGGAVAICGILYYNYHETNHSEK
ncbi:MAG TPA: DMT family transporter [Anaerovoracaceae bacterium]|nr:DMT family transporter [Anaerovoracaceae bacterium]